MKAEFQYLGTTLTCNAQAYSNKRVCIELWCKTSPVTKLTTNLPNEKLEDDEFFVKTWSENEPIAKAARASGIFIDTGKRVKTGYVIAEVWKLASGVELETYIY